MRRNQSLPIDLESRIVFEFALLVMALLALITLSRVLRSDAVPRPGDPATVNTAQSHPEADRSQ